MLREAFSGPGSSARDVSNTIQKEIEKGYKVFLFFLCEGERGLVWLETLLVFKMKTVEHIPM